MSRHYSRAERTFLNILFSQGLDLTSMMQIIHKPSLASTFVMYLNYEQMLKNPNVMFFSDVENNLIPLLNKLVGQTTDITDKGAPTEA